MATEHESPAGGAPWQLSNFSALWWGQLISILGERLTYLALVGLLAEHTHHFQDARSSLLLTLLANVMLAPVLLFSPFTGAWVDRCNLKRVLIVSDLLRAGLVVLIPWLYRGSSSTFPVYVVVFGLFTCNVLFLPAKSAILPEIVPRERLLAANAWLAGAGIAATAVGALAGGWVVDHWGWANALFLNGGTYLWSVVALALIAYRPALPTDPAPKMTWRRYLTEVGEGWAVVQRNRTVGLGLIALAAVWVAGGFLHVAGNQHVQRAALIPGMERVGVLLSVLGAGSGLSTWWITRHGRGVPRAWLLGGGLVCAGLGLVVFAVTTRFAVFAGAAFVIGISAAPAFMLTETLLQESTEPRQRGRVFSARDFLMRLVFLVGVSAAGAVTRGFGTRATLLICAASVALAGVVALVWARRPATTGPPDDFARLGTS